MTFAVRQEADAITFDVQVVPRASRDRLGPVHGERLKVQLTAPPVDGAANEALVALVAKQLGRARADVSIIRGETGRKKTLRVRGTTAAALLALVKDPT
jgi:uncharacterized protein (TIGR00251 family)